MEVLNLTVPRYGIMKRNYEILISHLDQVSSPTEYIACRRSVLRSMQDENTSFCLIQYSASFMHFLIKK